MYIYIYMHFPNISFFPEKPKVAHLFRDVFIKINKRNKNRKK